AYFGAFLDADPIARAAVIGRSGARRPRRRGLWRRRLIGLGCFRAGDPEERERDEPQESSHGIPLGYETRVPGLYAETGEGGHASLDVRGRERVSWHRNAPSLLSRPLGPAEHCNCCRQAHGYLPSQTLQYTDRRGIE